jgi:hypothetical protein
MAPRVEMALADVQTSVDGAILVQLKDKLVKPHVAYKVAYNILHEYVVNVSN